MKFKNNTSFLEYSMLLVALLTLAIFLSSCRTDEVEVPPLTGNSGHRLFLTIQADPEHLVIHEPGRARETSRITIQLKNQLGQGVPGEGIKLRIANVEGFEINIGTLSDYNVTTDSAGFARVTYTAPDTSEQPFATIITILAILQNPAYVFEVTASHELDLERAAVDPQPNDCIFGGPNAPEAEFDIEPSNPVVGEVVCFDASETEDPNNDIVSFVWDFGDGSEGQGPVVCHDFGRVGTFTVQVLVTDVNRNCDSAAQAVTVEPGSEPTCQILFSPSQVEPGDTVNFTAIATDPDNHRIRRYRWNFGDGSTSTTSRNTVTHRYNQQGTFTVVLQVEDETGLSGFCQVTVTVGSVGTGDPTCAFTVSPTNVEVGNAVSVNASTSDDDGTIVNYNVDFGDGIDTDVDSASAIVNKPSPYAAAGTYTVTLTVTDNDGNTTACNRTITVCPAGGCVSTTQCSDGIDNDGDLLIDFPADPGCTSAGDSTE